MNNQTIPLGYSNSLMYELEKAFYDERGRGARFRTTTVGRQYLTERCLARMKSDEIPEIVRTIEDILKEDGIIAKIVYADEDRLLRLRVEGCAHRAVEDRMMARGIEPFTCVPANLIALAVEEKLGRPVEPAEIKMDDGGCTLLLVLFDKRPTLDRENA